MKGADILVTSAYYEQFHNLGWFQMCLGRISLQWHRAVAAYHVSTNPGHNADRWVVAFIHLLWQFTRQLWTHRNQIVHGATVEETASRQINQLHEKVKILYQNYQDEPSYILPRHEHLFNQHLLNYRLKQSYDAIMCWIHSVEEARAIMEVQQAHLRETAAVFFRSFRSTQTPSDPFDSDSSYTPSQQTTSTRVSLSRTDSTASMTDWLTSTDGSSLTDTNSTSNNSFTVDPYPLEITCLSILQGD
jgi:hypothetical protein